MPHPLKRLSTQFLNRVLHFNNWLDNYNEVIWLLGDGRSGTTWIQNLINHKRNYRLVFEPFHPELIDAMDFIEPHQYLRSSDSHPGLEKITADIFSGRFMDERIDKFNRSFFYNGIIVKDIYANLLSCWARQRFPDVKIVLLIRNPFSVAISKSKKTDWLWTTEPLKLLNQPDLYEDYLEPFDDLIRKTSREGDYIQCQILIWAIINYVPLCQFKQDEICVVFYEEVYANPVDEISRIMQFVKGENSRYRVNLSTRQIKRPARVSGKESNIIRGTSPVDSWKDELTVQQIDAGMQILRCFGFENWYDNESMPASKRLDFFESGGH
jgi:hypothetical protein